jgi:hypothetical protein
MRGTPRRPPDGKWEGTSSWLGEGVGMDHGKGVVTGYYVVPCHWLARQNRPPSALPGPSSRVVQKPGSDLTDAGRSLPEGACSTR